MTRLAKITFATVLLTASVPHAASAQGGKAPKLAVVPLSVTIEASTSSGTPTSIRGDGLPYTDGEARLRTVIDEHGNLILAFGRTVSFSYGSPLPGTRPVALDDEPQAGEMGGAYISTVKRTGEGALQNLPVGYEQCVKLNWQYDHPAAGWWRHGYNRGIDTNEDGTSYAVVRRETLDVWTVEPLGGQVCGLTNPANTASVFTQQSSKGKWIYRDYGDYVLPFRLTLRRLP